MLLTSAKGEPGRLTKAHQKKKKKKAIQFPTAFLNN